MSKPVLLISEGLDRSEMAVIEGMHERGVALEVMLDPGKPAYSALEAAGVSLIPLKLGGRLDGKAVRVIRRRVKDGVRLVHCLRNNRPLANTILATWRIQVPIVAYRGTMGNLGWWDPGSRTTYLHKRVTRLIAVSEGVRSYLVNEIGLEQKKVVTIHKGHCPAWYEVKDPSDPELLNIQPDEFVIACVANMRPLKGVDTLIKALEYLPAKPIIHLLLVGKVLDENIYKLAAENNSPHRINIVGYREDGAAIAGLGDAFVMASKRREGLPRAVIEAMSQGKPAIVTEVGGMPELVEHEVCGLVVPPDDPKAMAQAFLRYANDSALVQLHGAAARERIETAFHVNRTIEKTMRVYDEVAPQL